MSDLPPPSPDFIPHSRAEGARPAESASRAVVRVTGSQATHHRRMPGRLLFASIGFGVLFIAIGVKLTDATIISPAPSRLAQAPRLPPAEPPVSRAAITDRNGEVLAVTVRGTALYARPAEIDNPARVADQLVRILPHLERDRVLARISPPRQFAYIDRFITPRQQQAINDLGILGLYFETAERRTYPRGRDAAHVLGAVDVDGEGIAGVEKWYDERLRVTRDPLRLAIDIRIQRELREALEWSIERFNAIGGSAILMDVHTAEVLGMVSLPDFAAANLATAPAEQRFNRAVTGVYEPGSTFKLFTAAMALEEGRVTMTGGFDASRPIRIGRHEINDFKGKNRWLSLPEILAYSSNLASAHMAMAVGPTRHREFMGRMGMLNRTGVELPESAATLAPSQRNWRDINTMTIGFGHGISVTPLHIVSGVSALANGGTLRTPTVLAVPPGVEREGTRVISERTSEQMRRLMRVAVTDGSGRQSDSPGYFVGGKTGTAQKTNERGQYQENRRISSFVGAFPMNAPRYALHVLVDEPKPRADTGGYATAGVVAAPTARRVVERVAPLLGMVPETDRIAQIQATIALPLNGGRPRSGTAAAPAPRPTPAAPTPAMLPRTPAPTLEQPAPPIRRTDARDGIAMPRLVLAPISPETGRAAR
ncbi:peptidoglycan D,D-transpeptidase FtsI family protein [Sediminicoccus rosea]|jgi:cell division protein FtsI (penicillin-binding protein 3)|uniref:Penicillin-binding protein 2 n=1 Tax=Sediminicoccus rosea TaxID=1225128 RepID=A0ABZ0PFA4_9PROT|nr:penicillin-binding protein 2 [Sediminicoccus rosea]WPB84404.1 penicillin-binding protein 2 [Sediminicoccus rosea]